MTGNAGLVAVAELVDRLGVVEAIDAAIGIMWKRTWKLCSMLRRGRHGKSHTNG